LEVKTMIGGDKTTDHQYGIELILDLHGCDASKFTRASITEYFEQLCDLIDMQREDLHFWDDVGLSEEDKQTSPHTQGTSAVQFILTSSIVIHALDQLKAIYINIFSCKVYDPKIAEKFTVEWFSATDCSSKLIDRV
jgi:S-adenosylmethionine/arginine decarboxylase-like enzyme